MVIKGQKTVRHQFQPGQQVEVTAFRAAREMCTNPKNIAYPDYGGRGIEFRFNNFREFWDEVGSRPIDMSGKRASYSLTRIDKNGHYEKGNVRWAPRAEQHRGKRNSTGKRNSIPDWKFVSNKRIIGFVMANPQLTYKEIGERLSVNSPRITTLMQDIGVHRGQGVRPHDGPVGKRFGKWEVISSEVRRGNGNGRKWLVRCDCGTQRWVRLGNLRTGSSTNCGCVSKTDEHKAKVVTSIQAAWTPERREQVSQQLKERWATDPKGMGTGGRSRRALTDDQVRAIRKLHVPGEVGYERLSKMFHIASSNIRKVVKCETYCDVSPT